MLQYSLAFDILTVCCAISVFTMLSERHLSLASLHVTLSFFFSLGRMLTSTNVSCYQRWVEKLKSLKKKYSYYMPELIMIL